MLQCPKIVISLLLIIISIDIIVILTWNAVTSTHLITSGLTVDNDGAIIDDITVSFSVRTLLYCTNDFTQWVRRHPYSGNWYKYTQSSSWHRDISFRRDKFAYYSTKNCFNCQIPTESDNCLLHLVSEWLKQSQWSCWVALLKPAVASNVSAGMDVFSSHFNVSHVRTSERSEADNQFHAVQSTTDQTAKLCWPTAVRKRCIQDFVKGRGKFYPFIPSPPTSLPLSPSLSALLSHSPSIRSFFPPLLSLLSPGIWGITPRQFLKFNMWCSAFWCNWRRSYTPLRFSISL